MLCMKRLFFYVSAIFVIVTFLGIGGAVYYFYQSGPLTQEQKVIIKPGMSIHQIAMELSENKVVSQPYLFSLILHVSKLGRKLRAGEYMFAPLISPQQVYQKLAAGDIVIHRLVIPEGLTTMQIIALVNQEPYLTGEIPDDIKEGELLPETYICNYGDTREEVIMRMRKAMQRTLDELWERRTVGALVKDKSEALIIASIVEKETRLDTERKRVAAVFLNRLKKNMKLQMDPTVIYAITEGKYVLDRQLTQKDLEIDSQYNTYKYIGLPPGPITNPGRAAIEAALNPEITEDLYFVADGTGGHKFAKTLNEHEENVRAWRKLNK